MDVNFENLNVDDFLTDVGQNVVSDPISERINRIANLEEMHKNLESVLKVSKKTFGISERLAMLAYVDMRRHPKDYFELSQQIAIDAEYAVGAIRRIIYDVDSERWGEYLLEASKALDISITQESNSMIKIIIPALVPKRKIKGAKFIAAPLFEAVKIFVSSDMYTIPRYDKCTICITHIYDKELSTEGRIRDYDNLELKEILDIINVFFLTDDSGIWCNNYQNTALGNEDATHILIMPQHQYSNWIIAQEKKGK
ncbi:MAG: DUF6100 family protein [Defluviitaleaceae bacterium]|nr:DUF6100 family protein [Defluviitaleaceae bacterium]